MTTVVCIMPRVADRGESSGANGGGAVNALVRTSDHGSLPSTEATVGLEGAGKGWAIRGAIRATGLYAGAVASALASIGFFLLLDPFTNAKHFVLTMLGCFVAGTFFGYAAAYGRLRDALRSKDDYREDMHKQVDRVQEFQEAALERRLSSLIPDLKNDAKPLKQGKPVGGKK